MTDEAGAEASRTALSTLVARAVHQSYDEPVRALDPVAVPLFAGLTLAKLSAAREAEGPGFAALRAHVATRTAHAEAALAEAVRERGVAQYVVLSAGYDTFAYRQPAWAADLRVFEVDRAATQAAKRRGIAFGGIVDPANLCYVTADLETEPLGEALRGAGADLDAPCFFSWLGATVYLTPEAVTATLREIAAIAGGAELAFTFAHRESADSDWARRAAAAGEPWLATFDEAEIAALVAETGFDDCAIDGPNVLARRRARRLL